MQAVQSGISDGAERGEGAMANINAGIGNLTGALTEMKDETLAGAQDFGGKVAAKGKEYGDKIPTGEEMKQKIVDTGAKAQAAVDADRAEWGVKDGQVDTKVLTDKLGNALNPGKLVDGFNKLVEEGKEQGQQIEEGHAKGKAAMEAEIAAKKAAPVAVKEGGRRHRRRRKSRKKRRKSRKKKRKSKRNKRMARKSRRKRRSRRRRGGACKNGAAKVYDESQEDMVCPENVTPTKDKYEKTITGGRKSRKKRRRRRKRSSKKSRRRRRR